MGLFSRIPNSIGERTDKTVIAKGTRIVGRLQMEALLLIDGEVEGELVSSSEVSVGANGTFKGDLTARKAIVSGRVEGVIHCDRLEILSSGAVVGEVEVREMTIEPGGRFFGQSREGSPEKPEAPKSDTSVVLNIEPATLARSGRRAG